MIWPQAPHFLSLKYWRDFLLMVIEAFPRLHVSNFYSFNVGNTYLKIQMKIGSWNQLQTFKCGQRPIKLLDKARENSYNTYNVAIDTAIERRAFLFYVFSSPHLEFDNLYSAEYLTSQLQFVVWILLFVVYRYITHQFILLVLIT